MRKRGSYVLCILLVTSSVLVGFPLNQVQADRSTLYVGGSGPGNYSTIQSAISAASSDDTIIVYQGTYYDSITINKPLVIIGLNTPILDAQNNTNTYLGIATQNCSITGFHLIYKYFIKLSGASNTSLSDMNIQGGRIYIYGGHHNYINNCSISDTTLYGLLLEYTTNNTIEHNQLFNHNNYGIYIRYNSRDNIIRNNSIFDNFYEGIMILTSCHKNQILYNNISYNSGDGNGISVTNCHNTTIAHNTIMHNAWHGIELSSCRDTNMNNNVIGPGNYDGVHLVGSTNSTLTDNTIEGNPRYGLYFESSQDNIMQRNIIQDHLGQGIFLQTSSNNTFFNNILNNSDNVWDTGVNEWNITSTPGENIIGGPNLGGNYWNDYSEVDTNGDGFGDVPYAISPVNGFDFLPLVYETYPNCSDLIITDIWTDNGLIYYQVKNIGSTTASGGCFVNLSIDSEFIMNDYFQIPLAPNQRYTGHFLTYLWSCEDSTDTILVCADSTQMIPECNETNNYRQETWTCDDTPPTFVSGPTVHNVTKTTAEIHWTTDEASDSCVSYGAKAGVFEFKESTQQHVLTHSVFLINLLPGTTYHYRAESTDASDNTALSKEQYFTTEAPADTVVPYISFFNTTSTSLRLPLEFSANASDNMGVDRVEFYMDDLLFDIAYSYPFQGFLDPLYLNISEAVFYGEHTYTARAYDLNDNLFSIEAQRSVPRPCHEAHLEIRSPLGWNALLYTDSAVYSEDIEIIVFADEHVGFRLVYDDMGRSHSQERWDSVADLTFYIDDDEIYSCSPDEKLTTYLWDNPLGLALGEHTLRIVATTIDGCHHSDQITLSVTQIQPNVAIDQSIERVGNYFDMHFYIRSTGHEDAYLDNMTLTLTGYQSIQKDTTDYILQPHYDPSIQKCLTNITFTPGFILHPSDLYTIDFLAVPILYDGLDYFNVDIEIQYHSDDLEYFFEAFEDLDSWEYLRGLAHEAFDESNYLIVTNPMNLFLIHTSYDVDLLLSKVAELAMLRNGVLGYYHTFASLLTTYDSTDEVDAGDVRGNSYDELVLLDDEKNEVKIYNAQSRVHTITHENMTTADEIAVGNVYIYDAYTSDPHDKAEIIVASARASTEGLLTLYQLNLSDPRRFHLVGDFETEFNSGDKIATGDIFNYGYDQIVIAKDEDGTVIVYNALTTTPLVSFHTFFSAGDTLLIADIAGDLQQEIIICNVAYDTIYIYGGDGYLIDNVYLQPLEAGDYISLGDVCDDTRPEFLIADASTDVLSIYDYSLIRHIGLTAHGNFQAGDALIAADLFEDAKKEMVIARAHRDSHRYIGEMEIISYHNFNDYDSRHALDDLLNDGGNWASQMNDSWISDGYLLLIGEDEIIPSFSCREDGKSIRHTDRYYASTDGGESGRHRELSVGRIIGDTPEQLIKPLQVSIDIYNHAVNFDLSHALAVAGYSTCYDGSCADINFIRERNDVADQLASIGFTNIDELTTYAISLPAGANETLFQQQRKDLFFSHADNQDLIHLAGHGNWGLWDLIEMDNITADYNPGNAVPLIYASSCLTGQYSEGFGFAERFFDKNVSSYIGATEVSYCCINTDLANRFYDRVMTGRSLGYSLMDALNSCAGAGPWYERDIRFYNTAIYHFYGDPKLTYSGKLSLDEGSTSSLLYRLDTQDQELNVTLPLYEISSINETDYVSIPFGGLMMVPGYPLVPTYSVTVIYPSGYQISDVNLINRSGLRTETGLNLTCAILAEAGTEQDFLPPDQNDDYGIWPQEIFTWEVVHDATDAMILSITMYPFYYNNLTTDAWYYQNYTFHVNGSTHPINITSCTMGHSAYNLNDTVIAEVFVQSILETPIDVIADAIILSEDGTMIIDGLPLRVLSHLQGVGSVFFTWNSTDVPAGIYLFDITLCDENGTVLDTCVQRFTIGVIEGRITNLFATPQYFTVNDVIEYSLTCTNTGSLYLDGIAVVTIVNFQGNILLTSRYDILNIAPHASRIVASSWDTNGVGEGDYYLTCYVLYDGMSTDVERLLLTTRDPSEENNYPILDNEQPSHASLNVQRPPPVLEVCIEDIDQDMMDVYLSWKNHTGQWTLLTGFYNGTFGIYQYVPIGNNWIWGNTTYTWSVNVTDGTSWTNETYWYTTDGCRYDVNNNDIVNFQDAGLVWVHRTSIEPYDGLYDVNQDGQVNFIDAGLTWVNRDQ